MKYNSIIDELEASGASKNEAKDLARLSLSLTELGNATIKHRTMSAKQAQIQDIIGTSNLPRRQRWAFPLAGLGVALASLLIVVVALGSALPGQSLYGAKRASERVVASIFPAYKNQMMMHRSVEIKALIERHSSNALVAQTVNDYIVQVHEVTRSNYTALEYCTHMLREARLNASGADLQNIDTGLEAAEQQEDELTS